MVIDGLLPSLQVAVRNCGVGGQGWREMKRRDGLNYFLTGRVVRKVVTCTQKQTKVVFSVLFKPRDSG